ncbi:MAG TPA: hypothetical protein VD813_12705, partial [Pseudonocardia sp.]|nr:hypothetical protein [Pseudonocardia sp.]
MTHAEHAKARSGLGQAHWGLISQGLNTGTNFVLSLLVVRSSTAAEFGGFALALVVYVLAVGLVRSTGSHVLTIDLANDPERLAHGAHDGCGYAAGIGAALGTAGILAATFVSGPLRPVLLILGVAFPLLLVQEVVRGYFFAQARPAAAAADDAIWASVQFAGAGAVLMLVPQPSMAAF